MKPFPVVEAAVDPANRAYNDVLTSERSTIEHSLGQLKIRFQMLTVPIRVDIEMVPKFILACCILHNAGKYIGDDWEDEGSDTDTDTDDINDPENDDGGTEQLEVRHSHIEK